ncbi:hypothetical protein APHAL10511_008602 [Amanita phalloides]|nr:hypothetical protein APHAL10511_008602 [Amanita phalloides]
MEYWSTFTIREVQPVDRIIFNTDDSSAIVLPRPFSGLAEKLKRADTQTVITNQLLTNAATRGPVPPLHPKVYASSFQTSIPTNVCFSRISPVEPNNGVDCCTKTKDVTKGDRKLEVRPIAKVYGIVNLYKDAKNPENAHHLEEKLSVLENQAATVIKKIHDAMSSGSFQIQRRDLDALRKFIQIMCYRKQTFYLDEEHPNNILCAGFLKSLRESKGLDNGIEVWLYSLDYFLNTPHNDIVNRAVKFQEKDNSISMIFGSIFGSSLPTNFATPEDFIANDYFHLADHFYLGIVEAAPDAEFIMSNSAFGLWEGMINQLPGVHKLYIVSPRIALILWSNLLHEDSRMFVCSSLIDIPLQRAQIRYANGRQNMTMEELLSHRVSPTGQQDQVKFEIIKLTRQQTQNVNTAILFNVKADGSITFLSKDIMRKALKSYMDLSNPLIAENKRKYAALVDQLADENNPTPSDRHTRIEGARPDRQSQESDDSFTHLLELGATLPEILSSASDKRNKRLAGLLNDIASGKILCKSDYDRAYQVYRGVSMEEAGRYVLVNLVQLVPDITTRVVSALINSKANKITPRNTIVQLNLYAKLVETLPVHESAKVMSKVKAFIAKSPVPPYRDPEIRGILYDAIIVGLLDGFAKEGFFIFPALFPGISLLQ